MPVGKVTEAPAAGEVANNPTVGGRRVGADAEEGAPGGSQGGPRRGPISHQPPVARPKAEARGGGGSPLPGGGRWEGTGAGGGRRRAGGGRRRSGHVGGLTQGGAGGGCWGWHRAACARAAAPAVAATVAATATAAAVATAVADPIGSAAAIRGGRLQHLPPVHRPPPRPPDEQSRRPGRADARQRRAYRPVQLSRPQELVGRDNSGKPPASGRDGGQVAQRESREDERKRVVGQVDEEQGGGGINGGHLPRCGPVRSGGERAVGRHRARGWRGVECGGMG